MPSSIAPKRVVVTKKEVLGKTIGELGIEEKFEVRVTRLRRAGVDLPAGSGIRLQFGDSVLVVGDPEKLRSGIKDSFERRIIDMSRGGSTQ